jgi:hypothetical protein
MAELPNKEILQPTAHFENSDKVLLYADGGAGKSFSLATTFIDAPEDRRTVVLMTERNASSGLERGLRHYGINLKPEQLIYAFPKQKTKSFSNLKRAVTNFAKETKVDALKGKAQTTQGKEYYTYLTDIIDKLESFSGIDYVTGEEVKLGNIGEFKTNTVLAIDGLSPIGKEVWNITVGDKIAISQNDYMPAQNLMYSILAELSILACHVVLLAHEKVHMNDAGVIERITPNTWVGNANYSTLMGLFTDVIRAVNTPATGFKWQIEDAKAHIISRRIIKGQSKTVEPSFAKNGFFK